MKDIDILVNNIHIKDSYLITIEDEMRFILESIKKHYSKEECFIPYIRSIDSLVREWKAHNLLYNLHLFRSHTKDVDLNEEPWYRICIYNVLSIFY